MPLIVSTMTDSVEYTQYRHSEGGGTPEAIKSVIVKGGANLAQKRLVILGEGSTKAGISTRVTDEELEFLEAHPLFQTHKKGGFIEVTKFSKTDPEKLAKEMALDKASSQITEADTDPKNPDARLKGHKLKGATE